MLARLDKLYSCSVEFLQTGQAFAWNKAIIIIEGYVVDLSTENIVLLDVSAESVMTSHFYIAKFCRPSFCAKKGKG